MVLTSADKLATIESVTLSFFFADSMSFLSVDNVFKIEEYYFR